MRDVSNRPSVLENINGDVGGFDQVTKCIVFYEAQVGGWLSWKEKPPTNARNNEW